MMNKIEENTEYLIYPGIKLLYLSENLRNDQTDTAQCSSNVLMLCHCREGNMEYHLRKEFFSITPGDLLIVHAGDAFPSYQFPSKHYQGITIFLDIAKAPSCLSCFLEDVEVQPDALIRKFCREKVGTILHAHPSVEHIFSDWYSVPPQIQKGYFKTKVLELLLFLSALPLRTDMPGSETITKSQIDLTQHVCQYLTAHMEKHITLKQLSEQFHVSGTYIRSSFKQIYGTSLYSFIRAEKMRSAADMLEYTDKSILEIAGSHGYDNGSKFASAFRDVIGMAPSEYRNRCCQKKSIHSV